MRSFFLYSVILGFFCGVGAALMLSLSYVHAELLLIIAGTAIIQNKVRHKANDKSVFSGVLALFCIAAAFGVARVSFEATPSVLTESLQSDVVLYGSIVREPDIRDTMIHITVAPHDLAREKILVTFSRFGAPMFAYGDSVMVRGTLERGESFETETGRIFNYEGYLQARDIRATIPFAEVTQVSSGPETFTRALYAKKADFLERLTKVLPEPHAGLGAGILLGVKRALGESLDDIFRRTGITHIVVLSGYNIMILVSTLGYLLSFFLSPRIRTFIGIGCIGVFALLVGFSATVVRASLMAMLLLIAQATGRTYSIIRALALVAFCMVIENPYILVYDPGFQLSFLATLGLILWAKPLEERLHRVTEWFGIRSILSATIAAQAAVFPLIVYYSGIISLSSVIVNVLVLPIVPIAMACTAFTGFFGTLPIVGPLFSFTAFSALEYIIHVPTFFAALPFSSITIQNVPFFIVLLLYSMYALMWFYSSAIKTSKNIVENDYADWSIEEEKDEKTKSPEPQGDSGDKTSLPFR